jgi:hypothetical protein
MASVRALALPGLSFQDHLADGRPHVREQTLFLPLIMGLPTFQQDSVKAAFSAGFSRTSYTHKFGGMAE